MEFVENSKNYHAPMHTAEHILNQTMVRTFGIERSFSNHIERKKSKCDYHFSRDLTELEVQEINKKVNEIISMKLDVNEAFISLKEAHQKFNTEKLPEDAGNTIRIINIGNYDSCLCSGEHVKNTSEIGKFDISTHSFENEVLRIRYKLSS
jgi:misacylated tRNA(Ala) deacylase